MSDARTYRSKYNLRYLSDARVLFHAPVVEAAWNKYQAAARRLDKVEESGKHRDQYDVNERAILDNYFQRQREWTARENVMMKEEMQAENEYMATSDQVWE